MNKRAKKKIIALILILITALGSYIFSTDFYKNESQPIQSGEINNVDTSQEIEEPLKDELDIAVKEAHAPFKVINDNIPTFTNEEKNQTKEYKNFSELDQLGRCGTAEALIGTELLPTEDRENIGMVKPTGWHTIRYDDLISDRYLYNRCHLIAHSLCGENANEQNLITGTRYMNVEGMLPFEMDILDYVRDTGNHVLYKVTPIFQDDDLVARGVTMEAYSIEDSGKGICFYVYCPNVQPGIEIDYKTGDSKRA